MMAMTYSIDLIDSIEVNGEEERFIKVRVNFFHFFSFFAFFLFVVACVCVCAFVMVRSLRSDYQ